MTATDPKGPTYGAAPTSGADPLGTCPEELQPRYRAMATRAVSGPASKTAAIRLKCLECVAWQSAEVRRCEIRTCPLWSLRG